MVIWATVISYLDYGTGFPAVPHPRLPMPPSCLNPKSVVRSYHSSAKNLPKAPFTWSWAGLQSVSAFALFQFLSPLTPFQPHQPSCCYAWMCSLSVWNILAPISAWLIPSLPVLINITVLEKPSLTILYNVVTSNPPPSPSYPDFSCVL